MFVVKSINNNSSLNSTDLQVVGSISAANLASGTCTIDNLVLIESLKANETTLTTNQLENIKYVDISSALTDSLYDLNQKIFNVQTVLTGDENVWIPDISGILIRLDTDETHISNNSDAINTCLLYTSPSPRDS